MIRRIFPSVIFALLLGVSKILHAADPNDSGKTQCAEAKALGKQTHLLIFDLTTTKRDAEQANRVFSFDPKTDLEGAAGCVADEVQSVVASCARPGGDQEREVLCNADKVKALMKNLAGSAGRSTRRWISGKGDLLVGYVFRDLGMRFDLDIDEEARDTRFASDLGTLLRIGQSIATQDVAQGTTVDRFEYRLTEARANLTITVTRKGGGAQGRNTPQSSQASGSGQSGGRSGGTETTTQAPTVPSQAPAEVNSASQPASNTAGGEVPGNPTVNLDGFRDPSSQPLQVVEVPSSPTNEEFKAQVVTGPTEHWFLSVDLPVENLNETEIDDEGSLGPKETPSEFLIGIDYMLGDLFSETFRPWYKGLTVKILAEASSNPGDTLGAGIGYRFRPISVGGLDLDMFSLFVARLRVLDEVTASDGSSEEKTSYKNVIGISFNLDKALEWLGNDSE